MQSLLPRSIQLTWRHSPESDGKRWYHGQLTSTDIQVRSESRSPLWNIAASLAFIRAAAPGPFRAGPCTNLPTLTCIHMHPFPTFMNQWWSMFNGLQTVSIDQWNLAKSRPCMSPPSTSIYINIYFIWLLLILFCELSYPLFIFILLLFPFALTISHVSQRRWPWRWQPQKRLRGPRNGATRSRRSSRLEKS